VTLRRARIVSAIAKEVRTHVPPYQALVDLLASGELSEEALAIEMADILLGRTPGRNSEDEIIAFLNSGCGIYDVAMAAYVYDRARQEGLGTWLSA
jgi:ornithine cyclodeaminase/alanine dehydrogenase-like protein (mu-crystallin family)